MKGNIKRWIPVACLSAALLSFVGGILVFSAVANNATETYQKVFGILCGILMMVLTVLLSVYLYFAHDTDPNFFLFDRKTRKNVPVEQLHFDRVNERMTFLLSQITETPSELWTTDLLLHEDDCFGFRSVYKPLVAYKMLYDLTESEATENDWALFVNASPNVQKSLTEALERAGDQALPAYLRTYLQTDPTAASIQRLLRDNRKYIRGKMLAYIRKHIEMFY